MDEYDKASLDAMTDQAVMILRQDMRLNAKQELYAAELAEVLTVQFGHVPELGRILICLTQAFSAAGALGCGHVTSLCAVLGAAGAQLVPQEEVPGD